jgi:hypothetical protein
MMRSNLQNHHESEKAFSTLMGEDLEKRRKFIEDNGLDVWTCRRRRQKSVDVSKASSGVP